MSTSSKKTALQNHNLWSCRLFFVKFDGESPRSKLEQEHSQTEGQKWPKNFWVPTRPVLHHWCQASRVRGCEMSLDLTGILGLLRQMPTHWFRLITNILNRPHNLAWWWGGTTDVTNARTCQLSRFLFDHLPVRISTSYLHHRILQKRSFISEPIISECSVPFMHMPYTWTIVNVRIHLFSNFWQWIQLSSYPLVQLSHLQPSTTLAKKIETTAHTWRRRVISRACTRLCLTRVAVSIFLARVVELFSFCGASLSTSQSSLPQTRGKAHNTTPVSTTNLSRSSSAVGNHWY